MNARASCPTLRVSWPEVLRVLVGDAERSAAVARLTASGFSADSFGSLRRARETVAESLVRVEDALELDAAAAGGAGRGIRRDRLPERRHAVRAIRRRLELEVWP